VKFTCGVLKTQELNKQKNVFNNSEIANRNGASHQVKRIVGRSRCAAEKNLKTRYNSHKCSIPGILKKGVYHG
jgi:hypothetical protein